MGEVARFAWERKGFHYSFDYFAAARDKEFAVVIHLFPSQGEDSVLTANIN